jgi:hypothetical protein
LAYHFIHIRKTGGTAIKEALKNAAGLDQSTIKLHKHKIRLSDIAAGDKVFLFFFLRDPVSRFVSGFNSRLRQGQPRYNSAWNEAEKRAFGFFPTANSLAEALTFEREQHGP